MGPLSITINNIVSRFIHCRRYGKALEYWNKTLDKIIRKIDALGQLVYIQPDIVKVCLSRIGKFE